MSLEIRNNMISRIAFNNKSLVPSEDLEPENDGVVKNNPEPANQGSRIKDLSNQALIANFLGKPLVLANEKNSNTQQKAGYEVNELTNKKGFGPNGTATADEARAQYKDIPDETFNKFFEIVEIDGKYGAIGKEPYSYHNEKTEKQVLTGTGFDVDEHGKPCNFQSQYGTQTKYTLRDREGGGSVEIVTGAGVSTEVSVRYLDANGNPIDSDGSLNRNAIDCSVIDGYGVGLYAAETLHERGKGWSGSKEKMEEKATELLNQNNFKSQIQTQYKTMMSFRGDKYDEKAFESFYNEALNQTLQTDGMISGRGARGLSKKGHAYCNVYNLVSTFLKNFDEMTKVK